MNNCVGRGNYRYFLALLLTLGLLEVYGSYLAWFILRPYLKTDPTNSFFSQEYWDDVLGAVALAINMGGLSIAGVGMLTTATAALPFGLLAYHCYLIWAGMTTNESQKWADLREDIADGLVFKASRAALQAHARDPKYGGTSTSNSKGIGNPILESVVPIDEPYVTWPVSSDQVILTTSDGRAPTGQEALWAQVWSLSDVDNLYDLGGLDNFRNIMRGQ